MCDELINSSRGRGCSGRKSKLVEDRYIVLFPCHGNRKQETKPKNQKHNQPKSKNKQKQPTQNTKHKPEKQQQENSAVMGTSLWVKIC